LDKECAKIAAKGDIVFWTHLAGGSKGSHGVSMMEQRRKEREGPQWMDDFSRLVSHLRSKEGRKEEKFHPDTVLGAAGKKKSHSSTIFGGGEEGGGKSRRGFIRSVPTVGKREKKKKGGGCCLWIFASPFTYFRTPKKKKGGKALKRAQTYHPTIGKEKGEKKRGKRREIELICQHHRLVSFR